MIDVTYRTKALVSRAKGGSVRRIVGGGGPRVTVFILTYDGKPFYTVSIMEFGGDKVTRETLYFADPFVAPPWRT